MLKKSFSYISLWIALFACGKELDRAEQIKSLRALGTLANPLIATPSTTGNESISEVTFYIACALGDEITATEAYVDDQQKEYYNVSTTDITIDDSSKQYTDYQGFRLYTFKASIKIPEQSTLGIAEVISYSMKISTNNDVEYVTGRFLVNSNNSNLLSYGNLSATITSPTEGGTLKVSEASDIKAEVSNPNQEPTKNGWFCTGGEIENRRALSTTWNLPTAKGQYSLVFTARGLRSYNFAIQVVNVTVE